MADLAQQIRERLAFYGDRGYDERPEGYDEQFHAALLAVVEMHRHITEDWTHVSETAYDAGRRWALEQAIAEIAEKLGIEVDVAEDDEQEVAERYLHSRADAPTSSVVIRERTRGGKLTYLADKLAEAAALGSATEAAKLVYAVEVSLRVLAMEADGG